MFCSNSTKGIEILQKLMHQLKLSEQVMLAKCSFTYSNIILVLVVLQKSETYTHDMVSSNTPQSHVMVSDNTTQHQHMAMVILHNHMVWSEAKVYNHMVRGKSVQSHVRRLKCTVTCSEAKVFSHLFRGKSVQSYGHWQYYNHMAMVILHSHMALTKRGEVRLSELDLCKSTVIW